MKKLLELCLGCLSVMLLGCASLSSGPPAENEMKAQSINYQLPKLAEDGKAIVYVVRPSIDCKPHTFTVFVDNLQPESEMGTTEGSQYIYFDISPGQHKIISKVNYWDTFTEINVSAKAGDVIFLQQEPNMGFITLANRLFNIHDYHGKYYVKTLNRGLFSSKNRQEIVSQQSLSPETPAAQESLGENIFIGTITGGNMAKGVGFSNLNVKIFVTAENGESTFFFVRSDSKVFDTTGKEIDYLYASRGKGKKVKIQHFIIKDGTGGDRSRSDFSYEIGHKGVTWMQFLD